MSDEPTPRTDFQRQFILTPTVGPREAFEQAINFARELERENARLRKALEWMRQNLQGGS